jgi:glycosyltransferase involved in cell wall biosynthesis
VGPKLLIDLGPAVGGHGQRGIGRYVRGLAASIAAFPDELADRIWAVGFPSRTLESFGTRAVTFARPRGSVSFRIWETGRFDFDEALMRSGASVLHSTDPKRSGTGSANASIVTAYDLIPLHERAILPLWRLDRQLAYRSYLHHIKSAARILAISRSTAEDLQERLGINAERIDIVYPLVEAPRIVGRIEPDEPTFLYVGALDVHKQPDLAMRAFWQFRTRLGSGRLRYIGPLDPIHERHLKDLAARLRISSSVSFDGRISDDELEVAYSTATALVSTSRIEGFGLPPVEAVLRGVPVVVVRTPAALETLDGAATIVPPDPEAIADAMAHPLVPPDAAIQAIRERYSIDSVSQSLADSYRRVLS